MQGYAGLRSHPSHPPFLQGDQPLEDQIDTQPVLVMATRDWTAGNSYGGSPDPNLMKLLLVSEIDHFLIVQPLRMTLQGCKLAI